MVDFKTRVYTESEDDIIGAEVLVYSDNGDRIGSIEIVNAEDLNDLREQLSVIDETYFTESRLNTILANAQETTDINATELSGFASSDFAKVSQLSNYALSSHTHVKTNINDLYNYSISCSDYNPTIDSEISVTVKVTNQAGNPVSGQSISIAKNNVSWKNGVTGSNGEFTTTYTCSEWGLVTFSSNNEKVQASVSGWKQINTYLSDRVTLYSDGRNGYITISGEFSWDTSAGVHDLATIDNNYLPKGNATTNYDPQSRTYMPVYLYSNGAVGINKVQTSSSSVTIICTLYYPLATPFY